MPRTYAELDETAGFFTRHTNGDVYGCTDLRNQGWGYINWYGRYTTTGNPNRFLFTDDGTILINSEQGVLATREYVDSLSYHAPDAISWSWPEQYGSMAAGTAAMTCAWFEHAEVPGQSVQRGLSSRRQARLLDATGGEWWRAT